MPTSFSDIPHNLLKIRRRPGQIDGSFARCPVPALAALQQLDIELDRLVDTDVETRARNCYLNDLIDSDFDLASRGRTDGNLDGRFRAAKLRDAHLEAGGLCETDA